MIILPVALATAKEQSQNFFIELYEVHLPSGTVRFAACDEDIPFNGQVYKSVPIQRGEIKTTVDSKTDNVELKIANVDQDFTAAIYGGLDFRGSDCYIMQILYPNSLSDPTIFKYIITGYLDNPVFDGKEFKVTIKSRIPNIYSPSRKFQLPCNAWFGDPDECGATKYTASPTIADGSTQTQIHTGDGNGVDFWKDGILTYYNESRKITAFSGGVFTLEYPFTYTVQVGATFTVEQGCDKSATVCKNRFNNLANRSGFPSIPFEFAIRT